MSRDYKTSQMVYKFLREHPGVIYHYVDLAVEIGIPRESANRVNAAVSRFTARKPEMGIMKTEHAGMYVFLPEKVRAADSPPPKKAGPMIYEEVGTAKDGGVIVRDEKGTLYRIGDVL